MPQPYNFEIVADATRTWSGFEVIRFGGRDTINRPYEYEIYVARNESTVADQITALAPGARAKLTIDAAGTIMPIHGIIAECEQLYQVSAGTAVEAATVGAGYRTVYRIVLVPRLWKLSLIRDTRVFVGQTLQAIITQVLQDAGFTTADFTFRPVPAATTIEYCCQYEETALDFITRWMEHEGLYFWFEQDATAEHLVIGSDTTGHRLLAASGTFSATAYTPPANTTYLMSLQPQASPSGTCDKVVTRFVRRTKVIPERFTLRSYDYQKPGDDNVASADPRAAGATNIITEYGHSYASSDWIPAEGSPSNARTARIANLRSQAALWQSDVVHGAGREMRFFAGGKFTLSGPGLDYLIRSVEHRGNQEASLAVSVHLADHLPVEAWPPGYCNAFEAINAAVQYRAPLVTPWPQIHGTISATTIGSGSDGWADLDSQGRYKVLLPFASIGTERAGGTARARNSAWIRQVQPYAGNKFGIHFPLPKGVEVKLAFERGNPDRPVIVGAVYNPSFQDLVADTADKPTAHQTGGIRTSSGSKLEFQDHSARHTILMSTGDNDLQRSFLELGFGGLLNSAKLDSHMTTTNAMLMNNVLGGFGVNINGGYQATMMSGQWLALLSVLGSRLASNAAWGNSPDNDVALAITKQLTDLAISVLIMTGMNKFFLSSLAPGLVTNLMKIPAHDDFIDAAGDIADVMASLNPGDVGVLGLTNNKPGLLGALKGFVSGSVLRTKQSANHAVFAAVHGNNYQFGENVLFNGSKKAFLLGKEKVVVGADELSGFAVYEKRRVATITDDDAFTDLLQDDFRVNMAKGHFTLQKAGGAAKAGATSKLQLRSGSVLISTQELLPMDLLSPKGPTPLSPGASAPSIVLSTASGPLIGKKVEGATVTLTKTDGAAKIVAAKTITIEHMSGAKIEISGAAGDIKITSGASSIAVTQKGLSIKAPKIDLEATAGPVSIKGKAGITLDGSPAKLNGKGLVVELA
ncbi:MAG: type VI secretion system Vgr family protein [Planctomycetota bacterium]